MTKSLAKNQLRFLDATGNFWVAQKGERIGGGAAGDVYKIKEDPDHLVKVFRSQSDRKKYQKKVLEMLKHPPELLPINHGSSSHHQLSWPNALCENADGHFIGYRMPKIDLKKSENLERLMQAKMRKMAGLPEFYGYRVTCAANLAGVVSKIHAAGHCIIDLKPANIQFYSENMYVSLLDCDGFRISGEKNKIFPAYQYTQEYIAPEAIGVRPEDLEFEQDNFALAVIIFRLLNNGIHPFQAAMKRKQLTIQEMVGRRKYAYGSNGTNNLVPSAMSIHHSFPSEILDNFDDAFLSTKRPSASDWFDLLCRFGDPNSGRLVRCIENANHAHFGLGCGLCIVEKNQLWPNHMMLGSSASKRFQTNAASWRKRNSSNKSHTATLRSPSLNASSNVASNSGIANGLMPRMGTVALASDPSIYDLDTVNFDTRLDSIRIEKIFDKPGIPKRAKIDWNSWPILSSKWIVWPLRIMDALWLLFVCLIFYLASRI